MRSARKSAEARSGAAGGSVGSRLQRHDSGAQSAREGLPRRCRHRERRRVASTVRAVYIIEDYELR